MGMLNSPVFILGGKVEYILILYGWLLVGIVAYCFAIVLCVSEMDKREYSRAAFFRGILTILLGPVCFLLIWYLGKKR